MLPRHLTLKECYYTELTPTFTISANTLPFVKIQGPLQIFESMHLKCYWLPFCFYMEARNTYPPRLKENCITKGYHRRFIPINR